MNEFAPKVIKFFFPFLSSFLQISNNATLRRQSCLIVYGLSVRNVSRVSIEMDYARCHYISWYVKMLQIYAQNVLKYS